MLLLDTDVMIDVLRQFPPAVAWLAAYGTEEVVLPGFVVLELLQGCRDKAEQDRVERTVARCRVVWPTEVTCNAAMQTYTQFHLSHNLGFLDALIAHTAILLGQPLYTFNQKHYTVVPGLTTVQPYARTEAP
jgi:predicted nucleic acid-binding protein